MADEILKKYNHLLEGIICSFIIESIVVEMKKYKKRDVDCTQLKNINLVFLSIQTRDSFNNSKKCSMLLAVSCVLRSTMHTNI